MASSLEEFLSIKPEETKIETVSVKVKGGKVLDVDVKGLTLEQFKTVKKLSTSSFENLQGGVAVAQVEEITFAQNLCAKGIVEPNLNNAKLRHQFGATSNEDLVSKLFPVSSIVELGGVIAGLTMGDEEEEQTITEGTDPELIEEAKN